MSLLVAEGVVSLSFFPLTTLPLVKYFFIHNLELRAHLGFYIRDLSSRGTAYRFSFFQQERITYYLIFLFTALPLRPVPLVLFARGA